MNKPKQVKSVTAREIDNKVVILDLNGKRMFHELNEMAGFIWSLCDGNHTTDEICLKIQNEYDADPEVIKNDLAQTLDDLLKLDLIESV